MDLYLNNLSYQPNFNLSDQEKFLLRFIDVCERVQLYSFEKIVVPPDYLGNEIAKDISFSTSFYQLETFDSGKKILTRIKSLMANQFKISQDLLVKNELLYWIAWDNVSSDYLTAAYNYEVPVISFKTHQDFEQHQIDVIKIILDCSANEIISKEKILNLSDIAHFDVHVDFLNEKQHQQAILKGRWDALQNPLRFTDRVKSYLLDLDFDKVRQNLDTNQRVSLANTVGKYIAEMNGWMYKSDLSRKNNRIVFKALNQTAYLAIDTETVSFELHNRKGEHKGEYNFRGEKLEDSKSHKLNL